MHYGSRDKISQSPFISSENSTGPPGTPGGRQSIDRGGEGRPITFFLNGSLFLLTNKCPIIQMGERVLVLYANQPALLLDSGNY
uniref:Uncharacterized protein n=1 Tax=Mustela putorius furo TaxID=9669 RepID=M3XWQ1_MUSPF